MNYYAVREGKLPGIYLSWAECEAQVRGYSGAKYKKFKTREEAELFVSDGYEGLKDSKSKDKETKDYIDLDSFDFTDKEAVAYVDGSYDLSNHTYSYGVVYADIDGKENYNGRDDDKDLADMRNVSGELKGAMVAMELALENKREILYLHYDYMGIEAWAKDMWKTNKEGTKKYKAFYDSIKDSLTVEFIKVKAHSGIKYNEEADRLAKEAIL